MVTFSIAMVLLVLSLEFATVVCMNDDPINNGSAQTILTEQVCIVSNNSLNMTEIEGRCFLACVSEKFRDESGMWNYSLSIYWPFVTRTNCATSSNLYQCTVGCVRSQHLSHLENNLRCRNKCLDHCKDLKSSLMCDGLTPLCHPWISEECQITCNPYLSNNNNPCRKGCMLEDELPKKQNQSQIPFTPIGPPRLIPEQNTDSAGQSIFIVDLSGTVPELQDCDSANKNDISPVAFLFKFEDVNSHNISFNWTENPFTLLNLTGYACQELQVAFAVGNIAGLSEFSQPAHIKLNRNETMVSILDSPVNLTVTETVDTRIGFFGHVILNISWKESLEDTYNPYLEKFIVTLTPDPRQEADDMMYYYRMCGCNPWSMTISRDQDHTVSVSANVSGSLPVMSCRYVIQVHASGSYGTSYPLERIHYINTTFDPKSIQFECQRLWQIRGSSFKFTWLLPDYLCFGNTIHHFMVVLNLTNGTENVPIPIDDTISFQDLKASSMIQNVSVIFNTSASLFMDASFHFFEMYVIWNSSMPYIPPRHTYNCIESAVPPRPYPIENFIVTPCSINDSTISLALEWSPPPIINGELDSYDVCIRSEPLEPDEEILSNTTHDCSSYKKQITSDIFLIQTINPVYIQIRAHNLHVPGNWSEASIIDPAVNRCSASSTVNNHVGVIAGLLGAFIVVLISSVVIVSFCYMRKKHKLVIQSEPYDPIFSGQSNMLRLEQRSTTLHATPRPDCWEIPPTEVIMENRLGEGAFGEVYKGVIKCPIINPKVKVSMKRSICTPVAVKLLKLSAKGNEKQDFLSEIEMMKKVAEGQNPHVVGLLGCVTIQEPLCLITEFVKYGDLLSYLRTNRRKITGSNTKEDDDVYIELGNISSVDLISFAYQISSGMEYLSSLGIVHRDLACRNILIDEGKALKITDFGLSRETDEVYVQKRTGRIPLKWMAIESIIAREFTSASDVWSFGITLWEIGTLGGFPYPSIHNEDLLSHLKRGYRMEKPDNCSPEVYNIMLKCWNEQPQNRPTFSDLQSTFDSMLLANKKDEYIDLHIDQGKLYYQHFLPEDKTMKTHVSLTTHDHNIKSIAEGKYLSKSATNLEHSYFEKTPSDAIGACCGDVETDQVHEDIMIRPFSMNLSHYQAGNPYVDQPLSRDTTFLMLLSNPQESHSRAN